MIRMAIPAALLGLLIGQGAPGTVGVGSASAIRLTGSVEVTR
jgi:hypothetical protein